MDDNVKKLLKQYELSDLIDDWFKAKTDQDINDCLSYNSKMELEDAVQAVEDWIEDSDHTTTNN